mmetsp:Transcript_86719/g.260351  ORF Transcript_86719/g.260351 Transcript_86719/m.260351 type:complete len:200 (-) Transcript_86719:61-660(-)
MRPYLLLTHPTAPHQRTCRPLPLAFAGSILPSPLPLPFPTPPAWSPASRASSCWFCGLSPSTKWSHSWPWSGRSTLCAHFRFDGGSVWIHEGNHPFLSRSQKRPCRESAPSSSSIRSSARDSRRIRTMSNQQTADHVGFHALKLRQCRPSCEYFCFLSRQTSYESCHMRPVTGTSTGTRWLPPSRKVSKPLASPHCCIE